MIVNVRTTQATGTAERDTAAAMLADLAKGKRVTLGADKGYDTRGLVKTCRELRLTPHVAQNIRRTGGSAIDGRTVRHPGYEVSMRSASPESNSPSSTNAWAGRLGISLGSVAVTTISSAFAGSGLLPPSVRDPPPAGIVLRWVPTTVEVTSTVIVLGKDGRKQYKISPGLLRPLRDVSWVNYVLE